LRGGGHGEVAEAAAEIQHASAQMRQDFLFEGIELEVLPFDLLTELAVEEVNAVAGIHAVILHHRSHNRQRAPMIR
jgi:hypothetical protein